MKMQGVFAGLMKFLQEVDQETMSKVTTLYVSQLMVSVTEEQLKEAFAPHGEITKCHIVRNPVSGESRGFAFIDYAVRSLPHSLFV